MPCYDFVHITGLTVVELNSVSGIPGSLDVTDWDN